MRFHPLLLEMAGGRLTTLPRMVRERPGWHAPAELPVRRAPLLLRSNGAMAASGSFGWSDIGH